jgi:hypothetical protein
VEDGGAAPRGGQGHRAEGRAAEADAHAPGGLQGPRARGCRGRARRGEEGGARREGKGRKREREETGGAGSSPRGSNSGDHNLQNLGHHGGERDGREREVAAREKSNERKGTRGRAWGAGGARGARAELGWAGLGWAAPRVKTPWNAQPQIGIQSAKQNPKRN